MSSSSEEVTQKGQAQARASHGRLADLCLKIAEELAGSLPLAAFLTLSSVAVAGKKGPM